MQCDTWRSGQDDASTRALQCQSTSVGVVVVSPLSHRSKKWPSWHETGAGTRRRAVRGSVQSGELRS